MLNYSYVGFNDSPEDGSAINYCESLPYLFNQLMIIWKCGYKSAIVTDNNQRISYYLCEDDLRMIYKLNNNVQFHEAYEWLFEKCQSFKEA